ncbi:MAG: large ribosomal subunit protein bL34 [Gemmatimonadales bacterium]
MRRPRRGRSPRSARARSGSWKLALRLIEDALPGFLGGEQYPYSTTVGGFSRAVNGTGRVCTGQPRRAAACEIRSPAHRAECSGHEAIVSPSDNRYINKRGFRARLATRWGRAVLSRRRKRGVDTPSAFQRLTEHVSLSLN